MAKNPRTPFIADGFTERGYIAEVPNLHCAIRFEYRPLSQAQREELIRANAKTPAHVAARSTVTLVATKIVSWDVCDAHGEPVPVTADNLRRLRPAVYERLLGIVTGIEGGDAAPEATPEEEAEHQADMKAAAETGLTVGEARTERQEKN